MTASLLRIAILGRGDISARYAETLSQAKGLTLVGCASRTVGSSDPASESRWLELTANELFDRRDIDLLVNLTPPLVHAETTGRALEAGFHVYSEKPLAATLEAADAIMALAVERGRTLACAPATFLGPAQQTARRLIDDGDLGEILGAAATMVYPGPDLWHHNPDALFGPAAGPVFDMGVYDVTALVHLVGPVSRVTAAGGRTRGTRTILAGPRTGEAFDVAVPTHAAALVTFASGPTATLTLSFDGLGASSPGIEIYGSRATLTLPRSGEFTGTMGISREFRRWEPVEPLAGWSNGLWPIGVIEAADAIRNRRMPRTSSDVGRHVLEVLIALMTSIETGDSISVTSRPDRPPPLEPDAYARLVGPSKMEHAA